jgi:hypothetical protein
MFRRVVGRPVLPRMDLVAQRRRTMSRCQRRIVSGVTSSRSPWRRAFGITPTRAASSARSSSISCGSSITGPSSSHRHQGTHADARGPRPGTEILTGVLEATMRDP